MAPPKCEEDPLPCPSWIFSAGTNTHVAKDRSWFADDYMPVKSFIRSIFGDTLRVIGIGTVNLPTKVTAKKTGPTSHGTLRLENVLHAPSARCNIVGTPIRASYDVSLLRMAFTDRATGRQVAYCKLDSQPSEIRLSGPPIGPKVGPSPFDPTTPYVISVFWPESEQARVFTEVRFKNGIESILSGFDENEVSEQVRSMLRNIVLEELRTYEDKDEDEDDSSMGGGESDPYAQYADHLFTEKQLRRIKGDYGSSVNFMRSYGLKFYKDEDCDKAQAIANAMDDSEDSDADLTDSERSYQEPQVQWLESKYGSTQNFLLIQKLNPAYGSDCNDARIRAEALMAKAGVADNDSDASWLDRYDITNDATDRLFSPLELRYVRCWYGSSRNFMAISGYDATIEADCKMAQAAVQNKMKGEDEKDCE